MSDSLHLPRRHKHPLLSIQPNGKVHPADRESTPTEPAAKVHFAEPPKLPAHKEAAPIAHKRHRWPTSDRNSLRIRAVHAASTDHLVEQAKRGALDAVHALRAPAMIRLVEQRLAHKEQHLVLSRHDITLEAAANDRLAPGKPPIKRHAGRHWTLTPEAARQANQLVRTMIYGLFDLRRPQAPGAEPLPRNELMRLMRHLQEAPAAWLRAITQEPHLLPRLAASLHQVEAVAVVVAASDVPLFVPLAPSKA